MAALDISSNKDFDINLDYTFHSPFYYKAKNYDTALDADLLTVAVHTIFDVEVGEAFIGGLIIVQTTFTSGGSATFQIAEAGGDTYTGLVAVANMAAGAVFSFGGLALTATDGIQAAYAHTSATTITAEVATAAFTAGKALIVGKFMKSLDNLLG